MYSWHTQHLAFHLSLLFSPLPMVIKATRTFTSFFAPPQHTAHTHHRKNWIGKKRNWKSTSIRTRLDFTVSIWSLTRPFPSSQASPGVPSIPCSSLGSLWTNTSRRAISAIFRWLIIKKWISTLDVGQNDSIYLHLKLFLCSKVAYQQGKKRWQHFLFISEFSSGQFHKCLNYCWPRH